MYRYGKWQSLCTRLGALLIVLCFALATLGAVPATAAADDVEQPAAEEGVAENLVGAVTVSVTGVVGPDDPRGVVWVEPVRVDFNAGAVAWDIFEPALGQAGCTFDAPDSEYGTFVQSITSPAGVTLENTDSEPYSFWSFLVNGEPATVGVGSYQLQDGDIIELVYYPEGEAPQVEAMPISAGIDADAAATQTGESEAPAFGAQAGIFFAVMGVAVVALAIALWARKKKTK